MTDTFSVHSGRDWRVDTLRGYFLVLMTVAHLHPNVFMNVTEYTFGYASAPDGFVFLSGLVSGWVYLKILVRSGPEVLKSRALRRARDIYLTQVALLALLVTLSAVTGSSTFEGVHPAQALIAGMFLIFQPGYCSILPMYCVFLLFTPLLLMQLTRGRIRLVMVISTALWMTSQFGIGDNSPLVPWIHLGSFNILAWQAYFVAGICIAFWMASDRENAVPKHPEKIALCAMFAFAVLIDRHLELLTGLKPRLRFNQGPDQNPWRFLDAACLGYLIYWVPRTFDEKLKRWRVFRFLNPLGQHSLQVFAFSSALAFITIALGNRWLIVSDWLKACLVVVGVLLLAIPARLHEYSRQPRSRPLGTLLVSRAAASE